MASRKCLHKSDWAASSPQLRKQCLRGESSSCHDLEFVQPVCWKTRIESTITSGTRWTGFSGNCLLAIPPKPHADAKSRKGHVLKGFRARDSFGVSPVVLSLWPRFEPFGVEMGVKRVPWFRRHQSLPTRKSPEFLSRNAKTRWGEPAGLELYGHVAVTDSMEAAGIEPASRDASDPASTCLANCYFLAHRVRCRHRCDGPASSFFNHRRARHGPWRFGIATGTPAPPTGPGYLGSLN